MFIFAIQGKIQTGLRNGVAVFDLSAKTAGE